MVGERIVGLQYRVPRGEVVARYVSLSSLLATSRLEMRRRHRDWTHRRLTNLPPSFPFSPSSLLHLHSTLLDAFGPPYDARTDSRIFTIYEGKPPFTVSAQVASRRIRRTDAASLLRPVTRRHNPDPELDRLACGGERLCLDVEREGGRSSGGSSRWSEQWAAHVRCLGMWVLESFAIALDVQCSFQSAAGRDAGSEASQLEPSLFIVFRRALFGPAVVCGEGVP